MPESTPQVSVILPTCNRAALLPRAIASVLNQSFRDLELIVVNDGSGDETEAVVASFTDARIVYVRHPKPTGDANARNAGAARAHGSWLAFQDDDDEWAAHKLAVQMQLAAEVPGDVALVGSALLRATPLRTELMAWPIQGAATTGTVDRARFVERGFAYLQSVLLRRRVFDELGGFDTAYHARSDLDFCLRVARHFVMVATAEVLGVSHESGDGLSLNASYRRADMQRMLERHRDLIAADRLAFSRYLYDLAKAELACGLRCASARTVVRALRLDPFTPRAWVLLAIAPFGEHGLAAAAAWRRRLRRRA